MKYSDRLKAMLAESAEAKLQLLADHGQMALFQMATEIVVNSYKDGGRLYIAGNGGSAADAQHLAAEFVCRLSKDRPPLPAEAFSTDTSTLTAIGNDYGFDEIFARQVTAKMKPGDVFLGITTSGNSPNIIKAVEKCRAMGIKTIALSGREGGAVKNMADVTMLAKGFATNVIQEQHIVLAHALCACVEAEMFG
ncbi:MAG: SIS domain-containing protein [Nitrospinae bacterium]|nr:SIS domain-containing protein [Nitrospinota bacterium]